MTFKSLSIQEDILIFLYDFGDPEAHGFWPKNLAFFIAQFCIGRFLLVVSGSLLSDLGSMEDMPLVTLSGSSSML